MKDINENKRYEPYKIPSRKLMQENDVVQLSLQTNTSSLISPEFHKFAEIEIDGTGYMSQPVPRSHGQAVHEVDGLGGGSTAMHLEPQAIEPVTDENRRIFNMMRQIALDNQYRRIDHSRLIYNPAQRIELSKIFYKQAVFMKDFEDSFAEEAPFSAYFPHYQSMSYEQLRTYFTWRSNVRNGSISNTSLSYAFLYIYELLNNIEVKDPHDGLDRLMDFWKAFRVYDAIIDKYLSKWIKDYHIYYELPKPFKAFIHDNSIISMYYRDVCLYESDIGDSFELFCGISKYDITRSVFYCDETRTLINDCFCFVIDILKQTLRDANIDFDVLLFQPIKNKTDWTPFDGALFFPWLNQPIRQVTLSKKEIYVCRQNKWTCRSVTECNRPLIGYIMKQMESSLRKAANFKHKLSASSSMIDSQTSNKLAAARIVLEKVINDAVLEFYSRINRTVVSVDEAVLEKIRREALDIQEKLIVDPSVSQPEANSSVMRHSDLLPESSTQSDGTLSSGAASGLHGRSVHEVNNQEGGSAAVQEGGSAAVQEGGSADAHPPQDARISDKWTSFKHSLTKTEADALSIILQAEDIKQFSDTSGVMLEVLIDGINQKASDIINDIILDFGDNVTIYQEYMDKLMEMVM